MAIYHASQLTVDLLAGTELFRNLPPDDLAACAACCREVRFAKSAMLFARGDPGAHLYLVAEGKVRLAIATSEGRELSFQIATTGDLFGEIAALDGWPRSAEATALTPVTAYSLERNDFWQLRAARPAISDAVISLLCRRLRDVSDKLEIVALYPLDARLARFLVTALGNRQAHPGRRLPLELGFSQSELALLLGASRPKINTALRALEDAGAIRRTSDRLFCDPTKLAVLAQRHDA
jgi:CRP/FNR family cyclic AMP-dependent transcriptional regulator